MDSQYNGGQPKFEVNSNLYVHILKSYLRYILKLKVKVTLEQATKATKAQTGSRCIALLFLQPRYQMVVGQRHAPASLPPGKDPVLLVQEAG